MNKSRHKVGVTGKNLSLYNLLQRRNHMAKQEGPIFLEGTLGGINYYFLEGEALARRSGGGFSRESIKEGANMIKVRESNAEFARCSQVNKIFKQAMQPFLTDYKDGTLHHRLMQLFLKIKDCDPISDRGKRSVHNGISVRAGQQFLRDFIFTPHRCTILPCPYEFNWDTLTFKVNEFKVEEAQIPDGADYMEISVGLIRFDFEGLAFERVFSNPIRIAKDFRENSLEIVLREIPKGNGILFSAVRVSFYQLVNGTACILSPGNAFAFEILSVCEYQID